MKAYRWDGPDSGLDLCDVPVPAPATGEVLIQVEACGLCHSDCHIVSGPGASWIRKRPLILGHEVAGTIVATGEGVEEVQNGDRVAVALIPPDKAIGLEIDGGFAQFATVPAAWLERIPDGVTFEQAAVATDSLATAYHAVTAEANIDASTAVAIIGLGGLGMTGVKIATLRGATVYAFDIDTNKFDAASRAGAKACFSSLAEAGDIVFDVVVDFVGMSQTITAALNAVKRFGRIVVVGLGDEKLTFPTFSLVRKNIQIVGSLGAQSEDLRAVLDLIAAGKLQPALEEIPFTQVNEGLRRLEQGKVLGRLFVKPPTNAQ
ncbi:putative alcohol dehydrogenase protein [Neofusicoccum parvum UCRNP2]|uniref:Putative alcohol dehydrogenase protein n=1 Tax=Botryosphaeria parva (strain UCR-NP2) TaxID=1287680 RepID=R1FXQ7_BOTPV|nr:putative alcohol dehydrogenase protein [Neofusicoccum parvum UCRNP2]